MADKITKDLTISEIFDSFPDKAELLADAVMNRGLHCVGCYANAFESLEEGFVGHGFTKKELNDALKELNLIISDDSLGGLVISLEASKFIINVSKMRESEGKAHKFLKLVVKHSCDSSSCGCVDYGFKFVNDSPTTSESLFISSYNPDVRVIVGNGNLGLVRGNVLDYSKVDGFKVSSISSGVII